MRRLGDRVGVAVGRGRAALIGHDPDGAGHRWQRLSWTITAGVPVAVEEWACARCGARSTTVVDRGP